MTKSVSLLLRVALAFSLLYPAISAFFNPFAWIGYFPAWFGNLPIAQEVLLHSFGALEVFLAVWLLIGKRIFIPSVISALLLFLIVVFNMPQIDVLFRDISIMLTAVALAVLSFEKQKERDVDYSRRDL